MREPRLLPGRVSKRASSQYAAKTIRAMGNCSKTKSLLWAQGVLGGMADPATPRIRAERGQTCRKQSPSREHGWNR